MNYSKTDSRLYKNEQNEQVFKIFSWGKEYILKSEMAKNKILKLEEYRYILWSYRPPIIIPMIIVSMILAGIYVGITKQLDNYDLIRTIVVNLSWIFYFVASLIYYAKYRKAISVK